VVGTKLGTLASRRIVRELSGHVPPARTRQLGPAQIFYRTTFQTFDVASDATPNAPDGPLFASSGLLCFRYHWADYMVATSVEE